MELHVWEMINLIKKQERIEVALTAMNAGVWFHTSLQYNSALQILRKAFDTQPTQIPINNKKWVEILCQKWLQICKKIYRIRF
jgi:dsRNA-specific ribonuclease